MQGYVLDWGVNVESCSPELVQKVNQYGEEGRPFFLITDFLAHNFLLYPLDSLPKGVEFHFPTMKRTSTPDCVLELREFHRTSPSFEEYLQGFNLVMKNLKRGNSYLTNLTSRTEIESNLSLASIFTQSQARYKVHLADNFTFFSPETFITIQDNQIATHPMKGTIDAATPNAAEMILHNEKEQAEHATIVDLLRNDLSIVADSVSVPRFRYIDEIETNRKHLLQVSSEIVGTLEDNWPARLGDIIAALLPAGSISGAPKPETVRIIKEAETVERGYYTGISLLFDGERVDSCVNIRFIKQEGEKLFYHSGGGITHMSDPQEEYQEMKDKVYVPIR